MPYPGGKAGPGVYQRLINEMPPHEVYVAGFAGHDAIFDRKKPAQHSILIDLDPEVRDYWNNLGGDEWSIKQLGADFIHADCIEWFKMLVSIAYLLRVPLSRWFIYLDPPYLMDTRSGGTMYACELDVDGHVRLLDVACDLARNGANVMISGYHSELYMTHLDGWRHFTYQAVARSGEKRTEYAWCSFPPPRVLHDSRYVGNDKREREKIRRRAKRLIANLMGLQPHHRQAVIDGVSDAQAGRIMDLAPLASPSSSADKFFDELRQIVEGVPPGVVERDAENANYASAKANQRIPF